MSKNQRPSLEGVWTAIVTPFRSDLEIDWPAYEQLLHRQEEAGITGIVVCGTTGESPTLTTQEKLALIRKTRATVSRQVRVMAGTGDNNTQQSVELSRLAKDAGADSLLIVTPPYNKPSTTGLIRHYQMIAEAADLPICLYHVPGRTAHLLKPEQIAAVCSVKQIHAVKEASGDIALFSRALLATNQTRQKDETEVAFLSGDDPSYLGSLAVGGSGVVSVVTNIFPKEFVQMTQSFQKGDTKKAQAIHDTLLEFVDALFCEVNPCPSKAVLHIMGLCENTVRPPLAEVSQANYDALKTKLAGTKEKLKQVIS